MKRPLCVIGLVLALTTWAAFLFSAAQSLVLSAAAALAGALLLLLRGTKSRRVCAALFAAAISFSAHTLYEVRRIDPFLRAAGREVAAEGLVTQVRTGARTIYYTLAATFPENGELPPTEITLRAYGEIQLMPGDVVRCRVKLTPCSQPERGLRLTADSFLEGTLQGEVLQLGDGYRFRRGLIRLRERLQGNLYDLLHPTSADVVSAMVLGLRDNVSAEVYTAVNRAGTAHLLSVSGLHLSILTAIALRLLAGSRLPRRVQLLAAIAVAFAFAVLVGFSPSIIRAFIMTAIVLSAGLVGRRGDSLSALGLAVTVICLVWPAWVLGKGFWLSAGSTLGILLYAAPVTRWMRDRAHPRGRVADALVRAATGALGVSAAAYTVTLPFLILFNGWISLVSPLANLLVTPFVPVVIGGGILCAFAGGTSLPVRAAAWLTDLCTAAVLRISQLLERLPFATASVDEAWMLLWLLFFCGVAAALLWRRSSGRLALYAATLAALSFCLGGLSQAVADRGTVQLATIRGCDAAVLIRDREAVLLGTPAYYEVGGLLRYLDYRGVRRIRAVVATDSGEQVGSGLLRLAGRYPVDCVIGPDDAYILGQLATALPEVPVYSGGYARLTVLGGIEIAPTVPHGDIAVRSACNAVLKSAAEYAIIEPSADNYTVRLHPGGVAVYNGAQGCEPAPLGSLLYGETRLRLYCIQ